MRGVYRKYCYLPTSTNGIVLHDDDAQDQKRMLEKMILDVRNCLQMSEECMLQRERRNGIELVRDVVERNLSKEVLRFRQSMEALKNMLDKVNVQLRYMLYKWLDSFICDFVAFK